MKTFYGASRCLQVLPLSQIPSLPLPTIISLIPTFPNSDLSYPLNTGK